MDEFQSALGVVIERLEEIRDGGGRWPRASREALALLQQMPTRVSVSASPRSKSEQLEELRARVRTCDLCPHLAQSRTQTVFGVGNPDADLMFVGEAPGADEDRQGEPFVGRAGQLLTKIIETMGFRRDEVYIANILKCRPPGNRNPEPEDGEACRPFIRRQIELIKPKVIVTLGKFALQSLLERSYSITAARGNWLEYNGIKVMPTFHPAYLLRTPGAKKEVWQDMKQVMAELGIPF